MKLLSLLAVSLILILTVSAWEITINATNQLEPVTFGVNENATDDFDSMYDIPFKIPIQDKVIMGLDSLYAVNIKNTDYPKNWTLDIGIPIGQNTTLQWNTLNFPASLDLIMSSFSFTLDMNTESLVRLDDGIHSFIIIALQCTPKPEACDGADNDCDEFVDEYLIRMCNLDNCEGTQRCFNGTWENCILKNCKKESQGIEKNRGSWICDDWSQCKDGTASSFCYNPKDKDINFTKTKNCSIDVENEPVDKLINKTSKEIQKEEPIESKSEELIEEKKMMEEPIKEDKFSWMGLILLFAILIIGLGIYFFTEYKKEKTEEK